MTRVTHGLQWLLHHTHMKVVLPAVVAAGLLAYVASLVSTPKAARDLGSVTQQVWWIVLALTIPYLAARLYVWNDLMLELGIKVPFRRLLLAFAGGEMSKSLPAGVYVENYLLNRLTRMNEKQTVRSTVATTAILGLETTLALIVVLIVGIPHAPWVRWGLGVVVVAWLVVIATAWLLIRRELHRGSRLPKWLCKALTDGEEFFKEGAVLMQWRTLKNVAPTALYMFVYAVDLFFILHALGLHIGWVAIITVYAAMVLAVVLVPIPTEIGIAEISALGALEAFGVPHHTAAVVSLALRILATGATILVAGIVFVALRGELKKASDEQEKQTARGAQDASPAARQVERCNADSPGSGGV